MSDDALHPRIREVIEYLDRERDALHKMVATVPPDRRSVQPAPESWSVDQVVEHLALVERSITKMLALKFGEARAAGAPHDEHTTPVLDSFDASRIVDRTQKIRNPRTDPKDNLTTEQGLAALDEARTRLKEVVRMANGLDLAAVTAPHPIFGPLNGYEWVAFTAAHTARHAEQIREIGGIVANEASR